MSQQQESGRNDGADRSASPGCEGDCGQLISEVYSARLPTIDGEFHMSVYQDDKGKEHVALCLGDVCGAPPLVRVHSECLTGDVFGSVRCDCRDQLLEAMRRIGEEGRGVLVYLRQEGRGIGLTNKVQAYSLQDKGLDTVDANVHLGLPIDSRSYALAASILQHQGATRIRLLTNNPRKVADLEKGQIEVVERVPHQIPPRPENERYLQTKAERLGHLLDASNSHVP